MEAPSAFLRGENSSSRDTSQTANELEEQIVQKLESMTCEAISESLLEFSSSQSVMEGVSMTLVTLQRS